MTSPEAAPQEPDTAWNRLLRWLQQPLDIAVIVYFRIAFAGVMFWHCYRYLEGGRIYAHYVAPDFMFKYEGFEWVLPWAGDGMFIHYWAMAVLALFIGIGFFYRLSTILFFFAITYTFLLEQANYLNHMYFVSLVAFTMIFVPAHRALSIDGWRLGAAWRWQTAPGWALWVLRAQMGFVYFYAGVAKLNGDWLRGFPLVDWLQRRESIAVIGPFLDEPLTALFMSWSGMLLDLFIVPALLWRRTRVLALLAALSFHVLNTVIFNIGIFPHFSMAATLLFLDPDWPRRLFRRPAVELPPRPTTLDWRQRFAMGLVVAYIAVQALIPLRPHFYPGNPAWTEEGHRFSWRQKLRGKRGDVRFLLTDPSTGHSWTVNPRPMLTQRQYAKMADRPHMILQFAKYLSEQAQEEGKPPIQVRASAKASLNGREPQPMIDSSVDLAQQPRRFFTRHPWILPLEVPLEAQWDRKSPPKHPAAIAAAEAHKERFRAAMAAEVKAYLESRDVAADAVPPEAEFEDEGLGEYAEPEGPEE